MRAERDEKRGMEQRERRRGEGEGKEREIRMQTWSFAKQFSPVANRGQKAFEQRRREGSMGSLTQTPPILTHKCGHKSNDMLGVCVCVCVCVSDTNVFTFQQHFSFHVDI